MNNIYRTIDRYGEDEIIINRSKFIGYAMPVDTEEAALDFIEKIRVKHRDATHNVYAYSLSGSNIIQRFSDDGEPTGTAGLPVLEVIKKEELKNVVVVVTRYFGGVKLGAGGLIRAYTKSARIGLEAGEIVDKVLHKKLKIRIDYTVYGVIENYLMNGRFMMDDIIYDDAVNIYVYVKFYGIDDFKRDINEMTSGDAIIEHDGEDYISMKDGTIVG